MKANTAIHKKATKLVPVRTAVDTDLLMRTGLDGFTLRRTRKAFCQLYTALSAGEKGSLSRGGTSDRFAVMVALLDQTWPAETWAAWLRYTEHTQRDYDEMCDCAYSISPWLIRLHSALFGIKVDFLLLGNVPEVDRTGASIDLWPNVRGR